MDAKIPGEGVPAKPRRGFQKWLLIVLGIIALLAVTAYLVFQFSPWPRALLIRQAFEKGSAEVSQALAKHVPAGIEATLNEQYRPDDRDAYLDVFYPSTAHETKQMLPTVVWVHGGAWISGSKEDVANYLKIVASHGYTAVSIGYSIAPGKRYPTPIQQTNNALGYLQQNAERLHIDPTRLVLAGDSAGSQIAAQVANIITSPSYASAIGIQPTIQPNQLKATVLNCGAYDLALVDYDGPFGQFLKTVLWSYSGAKNFSTNPNPLFKLASVADYVSAHFPPTFITVGNDDGLEPQSRQLAKKLTEAGVTVDTLFYEASHQPKLPHEYQFNLDTIDGQQALARILDFLRDNTQ